MEWIMPSATVIYPTFASCRQTIPNKSDEGLPGMNKRDILRAAYADFNARNIDAVISRMHPEVDWANGMEGGYVHGKDEVRAYWTRQFTTLDPHVDPVNIEPGEHSSWVVEVHQVVHD